jgi:hypothetical protein
VLTHRESGGLQSHTPQPLEVELRLYGFGWLRLVRASAVERPVLRGFEKLLLVQGIDLLGDRMALRKERSADLVKEHR